MISLSKSMWKRMAAMTAALALVMGSAACSRTDGGQPGASDKMSLSSADAMFLQDMLPHHEQAIQMSELALSTSHAKDVLFVAKSIQKLQTLEIKKMKEWLAAAGVPVMSDMGGMGMGMMTQKQMVDLRAARGKDFDMQYLSGMILHHRGAISMAQDEMKNGSNPKVKAMAGAIVVAQTAEVLELEALRQHQ